MRPWALTAVLLVAGALAAGAAAEPASQPTSAAAGGLDVGRYHACALLRTGDARCWGYGGDGALGYGAKTTIGDDEPPAAAGPVALGAARTAKAIAAGSVHTCALLDNGTVRCWGFGGDGRLGYANADSIGDDEPPTAADPVNLGAGRTATALTAGRAHSCAILDDGSVRCWGYGGNGRLGYANTTTVGDDETPASAGPVDLGQGRTAAAISAGTDSTCARLDDGSVRCWGNGANGVLGSCSTKTIGDDETPGSVAPLSLQPGDGVGCMSAPPPTVPPPPGDAPGPSPSTTPDGPPLSTTRPRADAAIAAQRARALGLRGCLRGTRRKPDRMRCLQRYGRTPGRVTRLSAHGTGPHAIALRFAAPGTDGTTPPAAAGYLVKQSRHAIRSARAFHAAHALCDGSCAFDVNEVGATITLQVDHLRARTTYYYAVAARDNVSKRLGSRSPTSRAHTR